MATHSSILVWEILWTEEPAGLQSMGSQSQARLSPSATTIEALKSVSLPFITKALGAPEVLLGHLKDIPF